MMSCAVTTSPGVMMAVSRKTPTIAMRHCRSRKPGVTIPIAVSIMHTSGNWNTMPHASAML